VILQAVGIERLASERKRPRIRATGRENLAVGVVLGGENFSHAGIIHRSQRSEAVLYGVRPGAAAFLGVDSGHIMHVAINARTVIGGDDFGQAGLGVEEVGGHGCAEGLGEGVGRVGVVAR